MCWYRQSSFEFFFKSILTKVHLHFVNDIHAFCLLFVSRNRYTISFFLYKLPSQNWLCISINVSAGLLLINAVKILQQCIDDLTWERLKTIYALYRSPQLFFQYSTAHIVPCRYLITTLVIFSGALIPESILGTWHVNTFEIKGISVGKL